MKLRYLCNLYLVGIHLIFFVLSAFHFLPSPVWLIVAELLIGTSLALGIWLTNRLFASLATVSSGADFIADRAFTSRFTPTGHPDVDRMIDVYNRMIDRLREERIQFQEQNLFLNKLVEASLTGVILLDLDGRIRLLNPAAERILQKTSGGAMGKRLGELDSSFAEDLGSLEKGKSRILTFGGRRKLRCWKLDFVDQGFRHEFILIEELTEELRRSEKEAYEKLIRLISHEVSNTVASASTLLESCQNYADQLDAQDRPDFQTALEVTISRTRELNEFVRRLAEVVRVPEPVLEPCDVKGILENVLVLLSSDLQRRGITISWDRQSDIGPVLMDRGQIEQVFVNVLKNAAEAIGKGGTVFLRLGELGDRPFAAIEDSGAGICDEDRELLFKPFFTTKADGHGVGLTVVQEILENHGFDYSLEARENGPGACFSVFFTPPQQ